MQDIKDIGVYNPPVNAVIPTILPVDTGVVLFINNHQSLIIAETSGSDGYIIGLSGAYGETGYIANATKITIEMYNPEVKLIVSDDTSATGSGTNVISAYLNPANFVQA